MLTDKYYDDNSLITLSAGDFTLSSGDWWIEFWAVGYRLDRHQVHLYNVTDAEVVPDSEGSSAFAYQASIIQSRSKGRCKFTSTGETLRLRHYGAMGSGTGFGVGVSAGIANVFAEVALTPLF